MHYATTRTYQLQTARALTVNVWGRCRYNSLTASRSLHLCIAYYNDDRLCLDSVSHACMIHDIRALHAKAGLTLRDISVPPARQFFAARSLMKVSPRILLWLWQFGWDYQSLGSIVDVIMVFILAPSIRWTVIPVSYVSGAILPFHDFTNILSKTPGNVLPLGKCLISDSHQNNSMPLGH